MIRHFLGVVVGFIALLIVITNTSLGLAVLLKIIPGHARAQAISGTLLHGWDMKKFTYRNGDLIVSIDEIHLNWQASALLFQKLQINAINIRNMTVNIPEGESQESAFSLPSIHLPINIDLKKISLENINLYKNNTSYIVDTINFSGALVSDSLTIQDFLVQTPQFTTRSTGSINLNTWTDIAINNQFTLNSQENTPISTIITGDQEKLALHIQSMKWLDISMTVKQYLDDAKNISIDGHWFIDVSKTVFPELQKLDGKFQFSGNANGPLFHPSLAWKLFLKDIRYNKTKIQVLRSTLNLSEKNNKKIDFSFIGSNLYFGTTFINKIDIAIAGLLKSHQITIALQLFDNDFFNFSSKGSLASTTTYSLQSARLNAKPLNLIFYPINVQISLDNDKRLSYAAEIQQQREKLALAGTTLLNFSDLKTHLSISSEKFTLINTDPYKLTAALHLNVDNDPNATKVTGNAEILNANIAPIDLSNTVTLTSDIIYVDSDWQPLYVKEAPLRLFIDVLLKIKAFTIDYKGIQAEIFGKINFSQKPLAALNAYGQLTFLQGTYETYGQKLIIQKNSALNFNGAPDNPALNITASKEISVSPEYLKLPSFQPYLIAGIKATGTVDEPNIHLFSDPSGISQQDILSYLLFGYPQSQLTGAQASILWNALSVMSPGQSGFSLSGLQNSIKTELGFSEFGLGNTSEYNPATQQYETGTAFVVGKRITSNLTATYNVGLLVPVNVLYLRYQLGQHWALQSDSSALGNGGDILYTIRRD